MVGVPRVFCAVCWSLGSSNVGVEEGGGCTEEGGNSAKEGGDSATVPHHPDCAVIHDALNVRCRSMAMMFYGFGFVVYVVSILKFFFEIATGKAHSSFVIVIYFVFAFTIHVVNFVKCLRSHNTLVILLCFFMAKFLATFEMSLDFLDTMGIMASSVFSCWYLGQTSFGRWCIPSFAMAFMRLVLVAYCLGHSQHLANVNCDSSSGFLECVDGTPSRTNIIVLCVSSAVVMLAVGMTMQHGYIRSEIRDLEMSRMRCQFEMILAARFDIRLTVAEDEGRTILEACPQLLTYLEKPAAEHSNVLGLCARELFACSESGSGDQFLLSGALDCEEPATYRKRDYLSLRLHELVDTSGGSADGLFLTGCSVDFVYVTPLMYQFIDEQTGFSKCRVVAFSFDGGSSGVPESQQPELSTQQKSHFWFCEDCEHLNQILKLTCAACTAPRRMIGRGRLKPNEGSNNCYPWQMPSLPEEKSVTFSDSSSSRKSLHLQIFKQMMAEDYARDEDSSRGSGKLEVTPPDIVLRLARIGAALKDKK